MYLKELQILEHISIHYKFGNRMITPGPFMVPYGWQQCWGIKHPNGTAGDAYPTNTNNIGGGVYTFL